MRNIINKLGLKNRKEIIGFLTVITSGQIIYSSFEAFKGTFYNVLLEVLNVSNTELGIIFSLIGISVFFYIPGGWINNRFSIKSILITGLLIRFITMSVIIIFAPPFSILKYIAIIWGLVDAFFWPAVLNGIMFFTNRESRGLGFGLLESVRRTEEVVMNLIIVGIMSLVSGLVVFKGGMLAYNLLILPVVYLIIKYIPKNGISKLPVKGTINTPKHRGDHIIEKDEVYPNKSLEALKGLFEMIKKPKIWLASIGALATYWSYIILIYTVPYLQHTYGLSNNQTAIFGVINTGFMGIFMGVTAGFISDYVFKSTARMMFASLALCAISLSFVAFVKTGLALSIVFLLIFSLTTFLANSIILGPIAEIKIPQKYAGSAMSVGSFMAYAPIFFVYSLHGHLLDKYADNLQIGYQYIFRLGIIVNVIGAASILILLLIIRRNKKQNQLNIS